MVMMTTKVQESISFILRNINMSFLLLNPHLDLNTVHIESK